MKDQTQRQAEETLAFHFPLYEAGIRPGSFSRLSKAFLGYHTFCGSERIDRQAILLVSY
jgi:hypothetical protein